MEKSFQNSSNEPCPRYPLNALKASYRHFYAPDGVNTLQTVQSALGLHLTI